MSPRIPVCAAIASLSLSACMSSSANLPRDAVVNATSASDLARNGPPLNDPPNAKSPANLADRFVILMRG